MDYKLIKTRLASLGYEVKDKDKSVIQTFVIPKVTNHICNACATKEIPEGLSEVAIDMVCGEFLLALKNSGQLDISEKEITQAVASITEGDFAISYNTNMSESQSIDTKLDALIDYLINHGEKDLVYKRKINWE